MRFNIDRKPIVIHGGVVGSLRREFPLMHPQHLAKDLMARYPDLPEQHAVFMAGLYNHIQAQISEFRSSQMKLVEEDEFVRKADVALASAAAGLQGFIGEIIDGSYRR